MPYISPLSVYYFKLMIYMDILFLRKALRMTEKSISYAQHSSTSPTPLHTCSFFVPCLAQRGEWLVTRSSPNSCHSLLGPGEGGAFTQNNPSCKHSPPPWRTFEQLFLGDKYWHRRLQRRFATCFMGQMGMVGCLSPQPFSAKPTYSGCCLLQENH